MLGETVIFGSLTSVYHEALTVLVKRMRRRKKMVASGMRAVSNFLCDSIVFLFDFS